MIFLWKVKLWLKIKPGIDLLGDDASYTYGITHVNLSYLCNVIYSHTTHIGTFLVPKRISGDFGWSTDSKEEQLGM